MIKSIALAGHLGPLARLTASKLESRGREVIHLPYPELPSSLRPGVSGVVCFPFPGPLKYRDLGRSPADLPYLKSVLDWATVSGVERIVLRSHGYVYGSSFKNYGLMEEDRISLLEPAASDRRWLEVEQLLKEKTSSFTAPSAAVLRLTQVLEPAEGDFVTNILSGRLSFPLAGYDPRVQFLCLDDAAQAVVQAVLSRAGGLFNITAAGTVPFRAALKASVPFRVPVGGQLQRPFRWLSWRLGCSDFPADAVEQIRYNFTLSSDHARQALDFKPTRTSSEALRDFLEQSRLQGASRIRDDYDDFGLDADYLQLLEPWFRFLTRIYWRAEMEGIENLPLQGPAVIASNHRGFMPFDGVVHRSLVLRRRKRHIRFLVIPSLFKFPFLADFLIKQGGVVASQQNSRRLLQAGELVGIFPEGISGAFRMYRGAYKLGPMGRDMFARIAIENQVPVIPATTVGHVEIFPILGKIHWPWWKKFTGWPFFPITPTFPWLPVPLPTKWHIRYLEPVPTSQFRPEDAGNSKLVREFSNHVRALMQRSIDDMLARRKHLFFGNIFKKDGSRCERPESAFKAK